jgi:hypothetical protein
LAASDGFAAVDALVALTILAATIALSLQAAAAAQRVAASAQEIRKANTLLRYLIQSVPAGGQGRSETFLWDVELAPLGTERDGSAVQLCRHSATARDQRSGRRYTLATLAICPARLGS